MMVKDSANDVYLMSRQDDANIQGGKWIVRLKKGLAARYWELLVSVGYEMDQLDILMSYYDPGTRYHW